jgi:diadenosine tetraphosphate (Ap4A) HIT family hydrolase
MYHYRKTRKNYAKHNQADKRQGGCSFCQNIADERIVDSNKTMNVTPNRVSYDVFEGRRVLDHLMIIPKRHVETLKDFTNQEKIDMMDIAGEYETKGYNVYARGVGSITRSVKHQHTHLIKVQNKTKAKFLIHLQKPYILINK